MSEKKKQTMTVPLPENGMKDLVKKAQTLDLTPMEEPSASPSEQAQPPETIASLSSDEFALFCDCVDKYTKIAEHGEGVWITKNLKRRLDAIKFHSGNTLGIRAIVNAALEAFLDSHEAAIAAKYFEP